MVCIYQDITIAAQTESLQMYESGLVQHGHFKIITNQLVLISVYFI